MFAVKRKEDDTIRMLLRYGADPDKKSDEGLSARKLAEEKGTETDCELVVIVGHPDLGFGLNFRIAVSERNHPVAFGAPLLGRGA